ncbi:MAG TPA: acyl-CoA dehydrogenase family protein [Acidimicrobiia bacterium]|jgi:alkylation response protein AidB-like acyl-CoA dehydrogenase|nr:acyl-CoA dehydrogenase family protein [Acidimicrobiia bacterium]
MNFAFTPEQEMLRDSVRSFLGDKAPSTRVRDLMETETGYDPELWAEMASMGLPAMHIPEAYGGAGFNSFELGIVLEETGRALTPSPLFGSVVLAANLLLIAGSEEQKAAHLPGIAAGDTTATVAIAEQSGEWDVAGITATAVPDGDEVVLNGVKSFVVDGHTAHTVFVAAKDPGGMLGFYAVDGHASGVVRRRLETMDMTRKQAEISLSDVRVAATSRLAAGDGATLSRLYDRAVTGLAFEQVGGAQMCMEMSVAYAKDRMQFGRPIGSFQAIKHKCADMLVVIESAKSAAYHAGWAADNDAEEFRVAAPLAKAYCSDAYFNVAGDTIQVHGGIGFTWEHDAHLYFKRAKSSQLMFGDSAEWRAVLAERLSI